ncbi:hypothetical protein FHT02_003951, partial [Sphingomonas xinjiangensis]|nr:hypothetical protein [Sphingomonas xinjiangensis]
KYGRKHEEQRRTQHDAEDKRIPTAIPLAHSYECYLS